MRSDYLAGIIGIALLTGAWFAYEIVSPETNPPSMDDIFASPLRDAEIPEDRVIVDYGFNDDGSVSYSYLERPLPERLAGNEILALRNGSSFTEFVEVAVPGDDPVLKLNTIVYAKPAFAQDVDGSWKYLEYATTTEQAFRDRDQTLWTGIRELFVRSAYADTTISPFADAGDGWTANNGDGMDPDEFTCQSAAWADTFAGTNTAFTGNLVSIVGNANSSFFDVDVFFMYVCDSTSYHAFLPFDTSSIPPLATITAGSLNVHITSTTTINGADGFDYITVMQTTQTTHTALDTDDHLQFGVTEAIATGDRKTIGNIAINSYLSFTLNATGRGFIKKSGQSSACSATTGITCLGLIEGHEVTGGTPPSQSTNQIGFYDSVQTGTSQDPYLSVTYLAPASSVPGPSFSIGGNGLFEVGGEGKVEFAPF